MSNVRRKIEALTPRIEESVGVRQSSDQPDLAPVADPRDATRRPAREFGEVRADDIVPDPNQPRQQFDEAALEQLAGSIERQGQLNPIRVRWSPDLDKWVIVSGERRWRAAKLAGHSTVVCRFLDDNPADADLLTEQLIENIQREDLRPVEEAKAFRALIDTNDWTAKELARRLSLHPSRISRGLALLKLPAHVQQQIDAGAVPARTGYELSRTSDTGLIEQGATAAARGQLTHEQAAGSVGKRRSRKRTGIRLTFEDDDVTIVVTSPTKVSYHHVKRALETARDEVELRIRGNITL